MSLNSDDECLSPKNAEDGELNWKRPRMEGSGRKGWRLMDKRTDEAALQEMGVSLLEPDDSDVLCDTGHQKPCLKRKRDIENVNPNVIAMASPRAKHSPRSPRGYSHGAGSSKSKSPRSLEKLKPLQPADQNLIETTLIEQYLVDEETPLGQSVSADYMPGQGFDASAGRKQADITPKKVTQSLTTDKCTGDDAFSSLSDEMMLSIFKWLPKRSLATCMCVCKRWYQVARDEMLWQRLDLGNKVISKDALGKILDRKPVVVRLASSEIGKWRPTGLVIPSRIQYLDLSMCTIDTDTLGCLLERSSCLKKLSVESLQLADTTCSYIGKCSSLEALNLTMSQNLTDTGLQSILNGCTSLQSLNISWCSLNEAALNILVTSLPARLQRLNIGGARIMTDDMVSTLVKTCPRLLELDLSDCSRLTESSVMSVLALNRLEHLALSRCYLLPPHILTKLSSMAALQYLDVWGMLPTASLNVLKAALPAIHINEFMFSAIARPTVGPRRTSIWGLRTRD